MLLHSQLYACAERKVTVVLTVLAANTHTLRSVEHTRPRYSEGTDNDTAQLDFNNFDATFNAQYTIDNGTLIGHR